MGTNAELQEGRKKGRKNYQLDFSVASVEIANGDCPEPLDRGLGTLLLSVMCSSRCQCGFGSDCTQGSVSFQISVIPFLNTPFSLKFVVCKFRAGNSFHQTSYPLIIEQNHISLLLETFRSFCCPLFSFAFCRH